MSDRIIIKDTVIAGDVDSTTSDNIAFVVGCSFGGNAKVNTPTLCTSISEFADAFGANTDSKDVKDEDLTVGTAGTTCYVDLTSKPISATLKMTVKVAGVTQDIELVDNANGCVVGSFVSAGSINLVIGQITTIEQDNGNDTPTIFGRVSFISGQTISEVSEATYKTALVVDDIKLLGYQYAAMLLANGFPVLYDSIQDVTSTATVLYAKDFVKELRDQIIALGDDRINYDFKFIPTIYDCLIYDGDTATINADVTAPISDIIAKCTELGDRLVLIDINGKAIKDIKNTLDQGMPSSNSYCVCIGNSGDYGSSLMPGSFWYMMRLSDSVTNQGNPLYAPIANQTGYVNMTNPTIEYTYNELMSVGRVEEGYGIIPIGKVARNSGYTLFGNITCLKDKEHPNNPYNLLNARIITIELKRLLRRIGMVNLFATNPATVIRQYDIILRNTLVGMRDSGYISTFDIKFTAEGTKVNGRVDVQINPTVESITAGVVATLNTDVVVTD